MAEKIRVLIVEDDVMIAEMTEEILSDNGYEVCGVASGVEAAVRLAIAKSPNVALIDLRLLNNERGTDVALRLAEFGRIGILYTTGNGADIALDSAIGDGCLIKPYTYEDLLRALEIVLDVLATGEAHPPFPARFRTVGKMRPIEHKSLAAARAQQVASI